MTREELDKLFSIKVEIDNAEALLKKIKELKVKQAELAYRYDDKNECYKRVEGFICPASDISYVKLVKRNCNSVEVEFDVAEWNTLIESIEKIQKYNIEEWLKILKKA